MTTNNTTPFPFDPTDPAGFGNGERRGVRVPANAIHRSDLSWFVVTYGEGAHRHLPQWLAASSMVCETVHGQRCLAFYLEWPGGTSANLQTVARMPVEHVVAVSMHTDSDEAAHAADLAWAQESWGLAPWPEGDLYLPADLA